MSNRMIDPNTATGKLDTQHTLSEQLRYLFPELDYPRDSEESVIESLEAAGLAPRKDTGDLCQVSVGATGAEIPSIGLMGWSIDFKRKVVDSTTSEQNGWGSKLASTAEWSATAEFAYVDGDPSQQVLRNAIQVLQFSSQRYNFFNRPESGRDSYEGNAIMTGIKLSTGMGKIFGMNITLEGDGPLNLIPQIATQAGTGTQPAVVAED